MKVIVGLHGLPGAGKDTIAETLIENYGYKRFAFADLLKTQLAETFRVRVGVFSDRSVKNQVFRELSGINCSESPYLEYLRIHNLGYDEPLSPRQLMQRWGDYKKYTRGQNYFINHVLQGIERCQEDQIVVTDVRYPNEANALKYFAADQEKYALQIVEVTRADNPFYDPDTHSSNVRLPDDLIDMTLSNNGTLQELHTAACQLGGSFY